MFCVKVVTNNFYTGQHSDTTHKSATLCDKSCYSKSNLKSHLKTHGGEKKYECGTCLNVFLSPFELKLHNLTHTGEKPYGCSLCIKKFFSVATLEVASGFSLRSKTLKMSTL